MNKIKLQIGDKVRITKKERTSDKSIEIGKTFVLKSVSNEINRYENKELPYLEPACDEYVNDYPYFIELGTRDCGWVDLELVESKESKMNKIPFKIGDKVRITTTERGLEHLSKLEIILNSVDNRVGLPDKIPGVTFSCRDNPQIPYFVNGLNFDFGVHCNLELVEEKKEHEYPMIKYAYLYNKVKQGNRASKVPVVCIAIEMNKNDFNYAFTTCHSKDRFNKEEARRIALERLEESKTRKSPMGIEELEDCYTVHDALREIAKDISEVYKAQAGGYTVTFEAPTRAVKAARQWLLDNPEIE